MFTGQLSHCWDTNNQHLQFKREKDQCTSHLNRLQSIVSWIQYGNMMEGLGKAKALTSWGPKADHENIMR